MAACAAVAMGLLASPVHAFELRLDASLHRVAPAKVPAPAPGREVRGVNLRPADTLGQLATSHPQVTTEAAGQELIVLLSVNGVPLGDSAAYLLPSGRFLVPVARLARTVRVPAEVPRKLVEGETFVAVDDMPGARVTFDETAVALRLELPPEYFPRQDLRYRTGRRADVAYSRDFSALVSYTVGATSMSGATSQWNATAESDVAYRGWLLRNQYLHFDAGDHATSLRGLTQLVKDDPQRLTRFIAGDFFATPTELTGGAVLAGLSYSRSFDLDPYFVRQPTAAFSGVADAPSDVSVFVGSNRVFQQRVGPGPFEISNVSYITGQRDVRLVVRDATGRERTILYPFYFADQGLAAGLHDFSYQLGVVRENPTTRSADFGAAAFSATHRVGVNDALTASFHAEGTREFVNAGPGVVLRSNTLGVASLALLASRARDEGGGYATSAQYQYQSGRFSGVIGTHRASRSFAFLRAASAAPLAARDDFLSVSYGDQRFGTLSLAYRSMVGGVERRMRDASVSYAIGFGTVWSIRTTYRKTTGVASGSQVELGVQYVPRRDFVSTASYRATGDGARVASVDFGNIIPEGEGLGYHVALERGTGSGTFDAVSPSIDYRMRQGELQLSGTSTSSPSGRATLLNGLWGGSVAYVGGNLGLSRRIDDAFGVVQVEPPMSGVRVRLNSQLSGRTDASGRLFLPRLVSYVENHVALEDKDIPINYGLAATTQVIVPQPHAGYVVPFAVRKVVAVTGSLRYREAGRTLPLDSVLFTIEVEGRRLELPTGTNGEFYFENVPPGDYPAEVDIEGTRCRFTLAVPATADAVAELPDVQACDIP